jgi:hypothetical protein
MTDSPQYTPAQILEMGHRAEHEGNLEYATQFYSYIADNLAGAPEAVDARLALERLSHSRQWRPEHTQAQAHPSQPAPAGYDEVPHTGPPAQPSPEVAHRHATSTLAPHVSRPVAGRPDPSLSIPGSQLAHARVEDPRQQGIAPAHQPYGQPSATPPADPANTTEHLPHAAQPVEDGEEEAEFVPGYRLGRFIASALQLFGWLILLGGFVFVGLTVAGVVGNEVAATIGGLPGSVFPGLAAIVTGLAMVFIGTLAQATFEAANNTREILEIERAKAGW